MIDEDKIIIEMVREFSITEIHMKEKRIINMEQVKENGMCMVCQDETNTKISCNHYFHEECINRWIE